MRSTLLVSLAALLTIVPAAIADTPPADDAKTPAPKAEAPAVPKEPDHITIPHVLIGFAGSVPGKNITRTQAEAKTLAEDILARARKGEDFDALVKQHTDDSHPGIYAMSNIGVAAAPGEYPRNRMVPAFGDAGFPLQVGEIGMAPYDAARSPFGWHVVKRIK